MLAVAHTGMIAVIQNPQIASDRIRILQILTYRIHWTRGRSLSLGCTECRQTQISHCILMYPPIRHTRPAIAPTVRAIVMKSKWFACFLYLESLYCFKKVKFVNPIRRLRSADCRELLCMS